MIAIAILGSTYLYLANEAGYLGTVEGKPGTWKERYLELKEEMNQLDSDTQQQVITAQACAPTDRRSPGRTRLVDRGT